MSKLPKEEQFLIGTDHGKRQWIAPSYPVQGENIEISAVNADSPYWSLEKNEKNARNIQLWSFHVPCDGSGEKFYLSYRSTSHDVTMQKKNAPNWQRYFEALLQPDGGVFLRTVDGEAKKLLGTSSKEGKEILETCDNGISWFAEKFYESFCTTGTLERQYGVPTQIRKDGTGKYWKNQTLKRYDPIKVVAAQRDIWLANMQNNKFAFMTKDLKKSQELQVSIDDGADGATVVAKIPGNDEKGLFILKSGKSGAVTIFQSEHPGDNMVFISVENDYLHCVSKKQDAVSWCFDVLAIPYETEDGPQYFPTVFQE